MTGVSRGRESAAVHRALPERFLQSPAAVFLFLAGLAFLCYGNVLRGPFLFDDDLFIVRNVHVHSFDLARIFTSSPTTGAGVGGGNFYRPLQMAAFAALHKAFGLNPLPFHVLSVLLHALNAFFAFLLLRRLSFSAAASLAAALLFLLHPVQTEAVSYISGLGDPLALSSMLGGLWLYVKSGESVDSRGRFFIGGAAACLAAALLSKESAVVFPVLALLVYFYRRQAAGAPSAGPLILFAGMAAAYLGLKFTVFDFTGQGGLTPDKNIYTENLHVRLLTFLSVLWDYAKLLVWPAHLHYEKPYAAYLDPWTWRAAFGYLLTALGAVAARGLFRRQRAWGLGVLWFFAALAPVSGLVPLNAMYLEHWLYVPLIGVSILAAAAWERLGSAGRRTFVLCFGLLALAAAVRTHARNAQWADVVKFYENELRYTESSARIHNNLAMKLADEGRHMEAVEHYRKAIALNDVYPQTHHNLANTLAA
ncbi:MAG: hypothetical protein ACT4O3_07920, partial [Elusimicrobiota bacterium]